MATYDPLNNTFTLDNGEADFSLPATMPNTNDPLPDWSRIIGNVLANILQGDALTNELDGKEGADRLIGGQGNDHYFIDDGNDEIVENAGEGRDTAWSRASYVLPANVELLNLEGVADIDGTGNDLDNRIVGNDGNNILDGGGGNDTISISTYLGHHGGSDQIIGGDGIDTVEYEGAVGVTVNLTTGTGSGGNAQGDTYVGIENVRGTSRNDTLIGNAQGNSLGGGYGDDKLEGRAGADVLNGFYGRDMLIGGAGADLMTGGGDNDVYSVDNRGDRVVESSSGGTADRVFASVDYTLSAYVEQLSAVGSSSISLTGNALNNTIAGNKGRNIIKGGGGSDTLNGGYGNDVLSGNAGKDVFVFNTKLSRFYNLDRITDFNVRDDAIKLENAIFSKLGSRTGLLKKGYFTVGPKAKDANDYIIYNKETGYLYYDKDGFGSGRAVEIAILKKDLGLKYSDFYVI